MLIVPEKTNFIQPIEKDLHGRAIVTTDDIVFNELFTNIRLGNNYERTVFSRIVKPHSLDLEDNSLRNKDLIHFKRLKDSKLILELIDSIQKDQTLIIYSFFHHDKNKRIEHGIIITTYDHRLLFVIPNEESPHCVSILNEMTKYVSYK